MPHRIWQARFSWAKYDYVPLASSYQVAVRVVQTVLRALLNFTGGCLNREYAGECPGYDTSMSPPGISQ